MNTSNSLNSVKRLIIVSLFLTTSIISKAHDIDYEKIILKEWVLVRENKIIEGSFSMLKNNEVYIEDKQSNLVHFPLSSFTTEDQIFVKNKYKKIAALNKQTYDVTKEKNGNLSYKSWIIITLLSCLGFYVFLIADKKKRGYLSPILYLGIALLLYGFSDDEIKMRLLTTTNPIFVDSAFTPFKPKVYTHWDNTYFYVESKGIPDHQMMTGITSWQQQVPIPQCYTTANNNNAWSIPLNPVIAASPVPVNQQHFLRGAIAVATNGIAIFNPYTNTGIDAFLDGQLDNWGGHCGRADDYHYHTAPLHLYGQVSATLPIAFALDGFAVYGSKEPDGSNMTALDANHGHYEANGRYHYHGTATAPYMIGNMVGQITEDNTLQIIPQAAARPVRPALTPLTGATITNCQPNANNNGYNLTYTRLGQTYQVNFKWVDTINNNSKYTFTFVTPTSSADSIYVGFSQSQCTVPTSATPVVITGISKTMRRLPDTGENSGYTSTFGEDADYLYNVPFFINNGNGTIKDTITGLLWQQKDGGEMTYENAAVYCDTLTLGGFTDWRLPTAHEGFSILNQQFANPAIDTNFFTRTLADYWWSSTKQSNDSTKIWCTNSGGGIGNKPKNETVSAGGAFKYHVRAVRDANAPMFISSHFVDNSNGTITDNMTNLIWQKIPYTDSLTWENALNYAESLTLGGYSDWRLPNIKELQSINEERIMNPSIDTSFFKITNNKKYWSSTTLPNHTNEAWYMNSKFGVTTYDLKTARDLVLCVRGISNFSSSYIFTGNGNWDIATNWQNNLIPPTTLPTGYSILINPVAGGECTLTVSQTISQGANIKVMTGKKFNVPNSLLIQQ